MTKTRSNSISNPVLKLDLKSIIDDGQDSGLESLTPTTVSDSESTNDGSCLTIDGSSLTIDGHNFDNSTEACYKDVREIVKLFFGNKFEEAASLAGARPESMPHTHGAALMAFFTGFITLEPVSTTYFMPNLVDNLTDYKIEPDQ